MQSARLHIKCWLVLFVNEERWKGEATAFDSNVRSKLESAFAASNMGLLCECACVRKPDWGWAMCIWLVSSIVYLLHQIVFGIACNCRPGSEARL